MFEIVQKSLRAGLDKRKAICYNERAEMEGKSIGWKRKETETPGSGHRSPWNAPALRCTECVEEKNAKQDDGTTRGTHAGAGRHRGTGSERHMPI